jgi:hypothetical protein
MRLSFGNIHQHTQHNLPIILHAIMLFHPPLQILFHPIAPRLGRFQDFVVRRRHGLALQERHDIRRRAIGNGEIERCVVVIVLLERALWIGIVERFDDFEGRVVMGRVVEGEVAVVVLLGGAFGVDFEEEFFNVEWAFLPGGKV